MMKSCMDPRRLASSVLAAAPPCDSASTGGADSVAAIWRISMLACWRVSAQTSIWKALENFSAEEMIDPRETRRYLARLVKLYYRRPIGPAR